MLYVEDTAPVADNILPQMQRDGAALPQDLADKPTLQADLIGYWDAFRDLDTERHHGMGFMRIPWSKIVQYAEFYGMDVRETCFFIREMDDAYLTRLQDNRRRENGDGTGKTCEVVQRPARPD